MKTTEERESILHVSAHLRQTAAHLCKSVGEQQASARDKFRQLKERIYHLKQSMHQQMYQQDKIRGERRPVREWTRDKEVVTLVNVLSHLTAPSD